MSNLFDAVTKRLIDVHPADWLALVGIPAIESEPFEVDLVDTDLTTVTSQADRVLRINSPEPSLQHIELETGHHGAESPKRLLRYSILVSGKYDLPVESAIVLLRREADSPALTGRLQYRGRGGNAYLSFEYNVIRVWDLPVDLLLSGGIGTLPLAPLASVSPNQLGQVIRKMGDRVDAELASDADLGEFWTTTNILLGLRYPEELTIDLLKGVRRMKESVTYQAILREGEALGEARGEAKGRAAEARRMLLLVCEGRLGAPSESTRQLLESIESVDRLESLARRLNSVESWGDLLTES